MRIEALRIDGAFRVVPTIHGDDRGAFLEAYRVDRLAEAVGHRFDLAQMNVSISRRGVLRGIHYADVPPGQAKYVQCLSGSVIDFIVDVRVGSPTFGQWDSVVLDDVERAAVYLPEGMGHAFAATSDEAVVGYLVSSTYAPGREHGIDPLDPQIGLRLPEGFGEPILSEKDAAAPSLAQALESGALPRLDAVAAFLADRPRL